MIIGGIIIAILVILLFGVLFSDANRLDED